jgi:hypothetical protein
MDKNGINAVVELHVKGVNVGKSKAQRYRVDVCVLTRANNDRLLLFYTYSTTSSIISVSWSHEDDALCLSLLCPHALQYQDVIRLYLFCDAHASYPFIFLKDDDGDSRYSCHSSSKIFITDIINDLHREWSQREGDVSILAAVREIDQMVLAQQRNIWKLQDESERRDYLIQKLINSSIQGGQLLYVLVEQIDSFCKERCNCVVS